MFVSPGSRAGRARLLRSNLVFVPLVDATTILVPMNYGASNFSVTLANNRTLGNPTGVVVGASGIFRITQDASGSRTLSYAGNYVFDGDSAFTIGTTASKDSYFSWIAITSTKILLSLIANNV